MTIRALPLFTAVSILFLAFALSPIAGAQTPQWRLRSQTVQPPPSQSHSMSFDSDRARTVLFRSAGTGFGSETWEWDGSTWARLATTGPSERSAAGLCFDAARHRTVLFGGTSGSGETWEWDGSSWSLRDGSGPTRYFHAMAYDAVRQRVVVQGGIRPGIGMLADTWEWDGSAWTQVATTGPGPRQQHMMTFDATRGRVVLFGGYASGGSPRGDLWEWDGSEWSLVHETGPVSTDSALIGDSARGRLVLFSGWPSAGVTWEWDGSAWTQVAVAGPPARIRHALAFDEARGEAVLFGGNSTLGFGFGLDDTWAWNGKAWTRKNVGPGPRPPAAMTFDPDAHRTLAIIPSFGGDAPSETWAWDGAQWEFAAAGPPSRHGAAVAYDTSRSRAIFFGGSVYAFVDYFFYDDTWAWDGGAWTQLDVTGPSARSGHAMAYDPRRGRVVLFGGWQSKDLPSETWEWDGAAWSLVTLFGPESREGASMVYDSARERIVLFGGKSNPQFVTYHNDTWEWDGVSWTQVATAGPSPRAYAAMQYDTVRDRILVFGGEFGDQNAPNDTWELRGSTWSLLPVPGPQPRRYAGSSFDSSRGHMVVLGGVTQGGAMSDTWEFGIDCPADFNADGTLNSQDFFDFLGAFFAGSPASDFNQDGTLNSQDFFNFVAAFFQGCD